MFQRLTNGIDDATAAADRLKAALREEQEWTDQSGKFEEYMKGPATEEKVAGLKGSLPQLDQQEDAARQKIDDINAKANKRIEKARKAG